MLTLVTKHAVSMITITILASSLICVCISVRNEYWIENEKKQRKKGNIKKSTQTKIIKSTT